MNKIDDQDSNLNANNATEPRAENAQNILAKKTFKDISDFYNLNAQQFKKFEINFGIDIWFLNHYRTYINHRNNCFAENGLSEGQPLNSDKRNAKWLSTILRLITEFFIMLIRFKRPPLQSTDCLIISNVADYRDGANFRFVGLEYDQLVNRPLFNIKDDLKSHQISPKNSRNSDAIFLAYLFKFTFISDLYNFNKGLNQLKAEISKNEHLFNKDLKAINALFWSDRIFYLIAYLRYRSINLYLEKCKVKAILLSDENSPQQKVIQYAAVNQGIKTLAFQHGNIFELHPAYIFGAYKSKPLLPNKTFTWGTYFTDLLINLGGYSPDSLVTSGRLPGPVVEKRIHPDLITDKKILLFVSQPQRDAKIRHQLVDDVIAVAQEYSSRYSLIIRPHPRETDDEFFTSIAEARGYKNLLLDRITDLNTHMELCSILLVAFSTVGTEFIPYFKPMLVLDYYDQDLINWIKEGVGIPVKNKEDLLNQLAKPELPVNIQANKEFMQKYLISNEHVLENVKKIISDFISQDSSEIK